MNQKQRDTWLANTVSLVNAAPPERKVEVWNDAFAALPPHERVYLTAYQGLLSSCSGAPVSPPITAEDATVFQIAKTMKPGHYAAVVTGLLALAGGVWWLRGYTDDLLEAKELIEKQSHASGERSHADDGIDEREVSRDDGGSPLGL